VIEELQKEFDEVIAYFYNPNISPEEEYNHRLAEVKRYCDEKGVNLIEGVYEHDHWLEHVKGLENEPEKGSRCEKCFTLRLSEAAQKAGELGCTHFATTLTMGRQKPVAMINKIAKEVALIYGVEFVDRVWRQAGGQEAGVKISAEHDFHRQDYCGCEFSIRKMGD
jgi:predicted adenine nucleotide alpha hydrolase (AANH) superfamily ATPase